ncbi:hypothetical protein [Streptomyces sp. B3I8]|uniref:hypothetical protein n=1 Tax=Streptomyces sp. B3I8 TaxID=3042303 RepID=UPI002787F642|nr:hypothetical protein [Streptomyces sp. B3I8]MDQ0787843.1 hypothetical protein [Streptomyces sp. B3I8]
MHANSRALLMREYLRRAAEWAQVLGEREGWPFSDLAERVAPGVERAPEDESERDEVRVEARPGLAAPPHPHALHPGRARRRGRRHLLRRGRRRTATRTSAWPRPAAHRRRRDVRRAFTRDLRREPTEYLRLVGLGHNEVDHVEITAADAARFTEDATRRPGPPRPSHER